jgi:hypothetical protein
MIKSRRMRWAGNVSRMGPRRMHIRFQWKDNIKVDLREIKWGSMNWIDLVQDRNQWRALVNMAMNLRVP